MTSTTVENRWKRYRLATSAPRPWGGFVSQWTTVDGVRIHSRVPQDTHPGRPTVVLVHGLAVSHRYLMPVASALLRRGLNAHTLDLPGFGFSGDPGAYLDVTEHADAVAAWLELTTRSPVVLLGNSFGCQVIVDLAGRRPDLCSALVLSGPTMDVVGRTAARQVGRWLRDLLREDPAQLPILVRDVREATPGRVWATLHLALRDPVEAKLPRLQMPTLVLRGAKEPIAPPRWARQVMELVPDGRRVDIPGAPHNCVYVAADELAAATAAFLAEIGQIG